MPFLEHILFSISCSHHVGLSCIRGQQIVAIFLKVFLINSFYFCCLCFESFPLWLGRGPTKVQGQISHKPHLPAELPFSSLVNNSQAFCLVAWGPRLVRMQQSPFFKSTHIQTTDHECLFFPTKSLPIEFILVFLLVVLFGNKSGQRNNVILWKEAS